MFIPKNKRQLIDYQHSYYYRQQRKKRRYKWVTFLLIIITSLALALMFIPFAQSSELDSKPQNLNSNALIQSPQLRLKHPDKVIQAAFPIDIETDIEINGLIAHVEMKQVFINPYAISLIGMYQFPLPENSAVKKLLIKIDNKEIIGEIMEKKTAQALYTKAKNKGKKASLVVQHRPNIFTNNIANIPAQSTIVVTISFIMPVTFTNGKFDLRLPLALTQRYQPKSVSNSSDYSREENSAKQPPKSVPEPFKITTTYSQYGLIMPIANGQSTIQIALNSGIPIKNIVSNSHNIKTQILNSQQNAYYITAAKRNNTDKKSFVLSWEIVPSELPQLSSFTQEISGEHFTLLTFFPPNKKTRKIIARDVIFIIDTSGSMQGDSIKQAKDSLQLALSQLTPQDSFNIIAFDDDTERLFPVTEMATIKNIQRAQYFIEYLTADGGTEMYRPLSNALVMKKSHNQSNEAIRQIVFITDGAVSNELELMQLLNTAIGNYRLYTVGIGAAPNGYFMKKAAQFGRGSYLFIQDQKEVQVEMSRFMKKISQPAISNITVQVDNQIHQNTEVYPQKIPDLYFNEPLQVAIKSQLPITSLQLKGMSATKDWYKQLILNDHQSSKGISSLWARRKIESLLDSLITGADKNKVKSQVIATSLSHQIISPYTSFIAIEKPSATTVLTKKDNLSQSKKLRSANVVTNNIAPQKSLLVAIPQTSTGWQLQLLLGLAIILITKLNAMTLYIKRYLKLVRSNE